MIRYTHKGGYGNTNISLVESYVRALPRDTPGRQDLIELIYDYECLLRVIDGKNCVFGHEDGSETRRIKLL